MSIDNHQDEVIEVARGGALKTITISPYKDDAIVCSVRVAHGFDNITTRGEMSRDEVLKLARALLYSIEVFDDPAAIRLAGDFVAITGGCVTDDIWAQEE